MSNIIIVNCVIVAHALYYAAAHKSPLRRLRGMVVSAWYGVAINAVVCVTSAVLHDGVYYVSSIVAATVWLLLALALHALYARRAGGHRTFTEMRDE